MSRTPLFLTALLVLAAALLGPNAATAAGDRVIPQVADGTGSDGTRFRTRIDFTNLGFPVTNYPRVITMTQVLFFQQNGLPWKVNTNLGSQSSFTLNLGDYNTTRLETTGTGPLTVGYVVVRSSEPTVNNFPEDFELNITAYYEVSKAGSVVDTVSVPLAKPTVLWMNPMQTDTASGLLTGFAIVNLSDKANQVTLKAYRAQTSTGNPASETARVSVTLGPNEQRARFLNETGLFPTLTNFYGTISGVSESNLPVAVIALLQTPSPTGPQYATLEASYVDSLRRNTYMYLRQGLPLDADLGVVDYFGSLDDEPFWDMLFETTSSGRRLSPKGSAAAAVLGVKSDSEFDAVSISDLRALNYTTTPIDMGDKSTNLAPEFAFAVKTGLGRFAKVRVVLIITPGDRPSERDLCLEIFAYK